MKVSCQVRGFVNEKVPVLFEPYEFIDGPPELTPEESIVMLKRGNTNKVQVQNAKLRKGTRP